MFHRFFIQWRQLGKRVIGPLALMFLCPPLVMLVWYTNVQLGGSVRSLFALFYEQGIVFTIYKIWAPLFFGTKTAWGILTIFVLFQLILMKILPGKKVEGVPSSKGFIPTYKVNGIAAFVFSVVAFVVASFGMGLFSPGILYDELGGVLGALNLFSFVFCLFLYFKGRFKPSTPDSGSTGHFIFDYFWGMDLHPKICGWDVKVFACCRFGMMAWALLLISYMAKQQELCGLSNALVVSVVLQLVYIAKFFVWEAGYLRSMDIAKDRAGFFLCWGCLVWVPAVYTSPSLFLVTHPHDLHPGLVVLLLIFGGLCILINYFADRQRQKVRIQNGSCTVWNKKPEIIFANYHTEWGEEKQGLLLASGWWGVSRHFHYIPEVLAALFWSVPALFNYYIPYFYLTCLVFLLLERVYRQERRCRSKYGEGWEEYCKKVPFRLIPFIY
ncbi:MAG: 7-dehydrocholesterol reductase [Chlamydiota bacterium]